MRDDDEEGRDREYGDEARQQLDFKQKVERRHALYILSRCEAEPGRDTEVSNVAKVSADNAQGQHLDVPREAKLPRQYNQNPDDQREERAECEHGRYLCTIPVRVAPRGTCHVSREQSAVGPTSW